MILTMKPDIDNVDESSVTPLSKLERSVYLLRQQAVSSMKKQEVNCDVYSLSTSTDVYKGQFNSHQLFKYYDELTNSEYNTHSALVHS
ncbi:hypothetical protein CAEBREN_04283 [Caenorhabditis brenneri]|uniref:Glutamine amidotransferase type-2 domain-containing protein n=1 Tax=Caenorhabditis brenneri TaxID=135651 RepID=G0NBC4_CAEBE|nr:hypothetical protein CAEBREN_04283 [Caenorhabditis brenneri]